MRCTRYVMRRGRWQVWVTSARHDPAMMLDVRDAAEFEEGERAMALIRQQAKRLKPILPGIGRGNSEANMRLRANAASLFTLTVCKDTFAI